jgi:diguanylate cyclase
MLFSRKKSRTGLGSEELAERLGQCEERERFFLQASRTALALIKELTLDLAELGASAFKKEVDELAETCLTERNVKMLEGAFERKRKRILAYAEKQQEHVKEREKEYKNIIELLTKSVATLDAENETYNQKILEESRRMEDITRLDDIKNIRAALSKGIDQMRRSVREKQDRDRKRIEQLSEQVSTLKAEVKNAKWGALRDGLTGAYNREALERYVEVLVDRNTTGRAPFSLLMVGIDNYEKIMETYGRSLSDRVVLAIAEEMRNLVGGETFFARCEEEVFALVLPGEALRDAVEKAKDLSRKIAKARYAVSDVQEGHVLSFTVSSGVCAFHQGDNAESLLVRGANLLEQALGLGTNQLVSEQVSGVKFVAALFRGIKFTSRE